MRLPDQPVFPQHPVPISPALEIAGEPIDPALSEALAHVVSAIHAHAVRRTVDALRRATVDTASHRRELTYKQAKRAWQRRFFRARLALCGGDLTATAKSLDLSRNALYSYRSRLGLITPAPPPATNSAGGGSSPPLLDPRAQ